MFSVQGLGCVQNLYTANARKFVCVGLGPLGCAPHFLWERNSTDRECIEEINNMVMAYNLALRYKLDKLSNLRFVMDC